jgi:hypothetical protein
MTGVRFPAEQNFVSSPQCPDRLWAHQTSYLMGTVGCFPGDKAAGCEADHSPPSRTNVNNRGTVPAVPICLHGIVLNTLILSLPGKFCKLPQLGHDCFLVSSCQFFSHQSSYHLPVMGPTQPPFQWVPSVKRPGYESDHSPTTSAEVNKTWIYTSTPPYAFME